MKRASKSRKAEAVGRSLQPIVRFPESEVWRMDSVLNDCYRSIRKLLEDFDWAEKLPGPERTEKLRAMIRIGLKHIKPNTSIDARPAEQTTKEAR